MSPSTVSETPSLPPFISSLRDALTNESLPLSARYRALFGLKHHACLDPPTDLTVPAITAITAGFSTPSALLKHEVAYCLGQTRNLVAAPTLRSVLRDKAEDAMVRHESAEALGALGDEDSLGLLKERRDDAGEAVVVRETCEIAIERIGWEISKEGRAKRLQKRFEQLIEFGDCLANLKS